MLKEKLNKANEECKEYKLQLNELKGKYDKLYRKVIDKNNYEKWNADMITNWIISLGQEYEPYEKLLRMNLKKESLDGSCLKELDKNDLHRFGVENFKHKSAILRHIQQLISGGDFDDEGATQTYV